MSPKTNITVLNIGSNSLKILKIEDGEATKRAMVTSLGEGGRLLTSGAISRTLEAIRSAKAEVVGDLYVFATEAVRSAPNKEEFLSQVRQVLGVEVDVISGEDEARYGYIGASSGRQVIVIDLGGASTEISDGIGEGSHVVSVPMGAQRLLKLDTKDLSDIEQVGSETARGVELNRRDRLVGIGGTITSLTSAMLGQTTYDATSIHSKVVSAYGLREILDKLARLSERDIVRTYPTLAGREHVIVRAGYYLVGLVEGLGYEEIEVSVLDTTEGYLFAKREDIQKTFVFRQKNS